MTKRKAWMLNILLCICFILQGCNTIATPATDEVVITQETNAVAQIEINASDEIVYPAYSGDAHVVINNNIPFFTDDELTAQTYESYSNLDHLNRPGIATACLGTETMPPKNEERGQIGMIKPAGWHTVKYPELISDLYLYNRCHLIGWQLSGENANELNLITGTRYLNVIGMLPFENDTADYIRQTGNHVMYRVTPVYAGDNLICDGLLMEARSVEDDGLEFCVYCYNIQPGITIDYTTGDSWADNTASKSVSIEPDTTESITDNHYVLNTNSLKIHTPDCSSVAKIADYNKKDYYGEMSALLSDGYTACKQCNPE